MPFHGERGTKTVLPMLRISMNFEDIGGSLIYAKSNPNLIEDEVHCFDECETRERQIFSGCRQTLFGDNVE